MTARAFTSRSTPRRNGHAAPPADRRRAAASNSACTNTGAPAFNVPASAHEHHDRLDKIETGQRIGGRLGFGEAARHLRPRCRTAP